MNRYTARVNELPEHAQLLKTACGLAVLFALLIWETTTPFLPLFGNNWRERVRHAGRNIGLGIFNVLLGAAAVAALWGTTAGFAHRKGIGVLNVLTLPHWLRLVAALALFDCWMYWWHRANHRLPFLWRFHRTHHSDPKMDVTTAHRFHFGEIFFSSILRAPVILLLGLRLWELVLYETLMFAIVQMHHANIALPPALDRSLRIFIVTPAIHKVHHSRWQPETDSNYSSLFSIWDRLFRTLRLRADPRRIQFGLNEFDAPEKQTLSGLVKTPLGSNRKFDEEFSNRGLEPPRAGSTPESRTG